MSLKNLLAFSFTEWKLIIMICLIILSVALLVVSIVLLARAKKRNKAVKELKRKKQNQTPIIIYLTKKNETSEQAESDIVAEETEEQAVEEESVTEEATEEEVAEEQVVEEEPVIEEEVVVEEVIEEAAEPVEEVTEEEVAEEQVVEEESVTEEEVVVEEVTEEAAEPVEEVTEEEVAEEPVVEEEPVTEEEVVVEEVIEEAAEPVEEAPVAAAEENNSQSPVRYTRIVRTRVVQANKEVNDWYDILKSYIMSHDGVDSHMSRKHESFYYKNQFIAKVFVKDKAIYLYLPLDAADYEDSKYKLEEAADISQFAETPALYRIKNESRVNYALELIEEVCKNLGTFKAE